MKLCTLIFFLIPIFCSGQVNRNSDYQNVLKIGKVGKIYSFDKSRNHKNQGYKYHEYDSLVLIYLGKITTEKGRILKLISSRWYWGSGPHGTTRIILFNNQHRYLGDYYLSMTYDIPDKIIGQNLVFSNKTDNTYCTKSLKTIVSFKKGIPKRFFLKCTQNSGDFYSFNQNLD
jgi:hypothetical protein